MTYSAFETTAAKHGLLIFGGFHPDEGDQLPEWCETLVLLGPSTNFWSGFVETPEWQDEQPDAMDRWSTRVLLGLAEQFGGEALFPFGTTPPNPFFTWALRSGQAWQSPVNLLVHSNAGLMVSYRGAIALKERLALPAPGERPCDTCTQPCLSACKPRALTAEGYDVPACKEYISSEDGNENITLGCLVRRSCPLSQSYARMEEQNAYHMRIFLGEKH